MSKGCPVPTGYRTDFGQPASHPGPGRGEGGVPPGPGLEIKVAASQGRKPPLHTKAAWPQISSSLQNGLQKGALPPLNSRGR